MVRIIIRAVHGVFVPYFTQSMGRCVVHHTLAYRASITDVTATDVTPVTDGLMLQQNGHFVPQYNYKLLYASYQAAGPTRGRIITPSFRQITIPCIRPVQASIVAGDESNVGDYRRNPLTLRALEEVQFEALQTSGGAAVVVSVQAWSREGIVAMPQGDIYTMRGTATATLTAGAWTIGAVTWQDTLPSGRYACVGLEYFGTTALAARLIFEEQWQRPGCIGGGAVGNNVHEMFRKGGLGVWGYFDANRMPSVEFLGNAADTAEEVYLDLIKVG